MAPVPNPDEASNLSSGLISVLACLIPLLAFLYVGAIFWTLDHAKRRRTPLSKTTTAPGSRYAPVGYAFLVLTGLVMIALPTWVLSQYGLHDNYPNNHILVALRLLLFSACWTCVTAAALTIITIHPTYSRHPISSIGTQLIWLVLSWAFWVSGAAVLSNSVPQLFVGSVCDALVYCRHLQAIQIFSLIEISVLTIGFVVFLWLAWRCAREVWHPAPLSGPALAPNNPPRPV
ncbi:hypothetical protein HMN09_01322300 [Mycena chlorophos]|uniref:MARVEL domain-containing protein n=1 Tax=Mycena chlorophos TaxID=658473 RepID=A0A8H6S0E8_MYCCL|nr:hypothetical protein HMN09_01322300 [Mycena chlorophos]